jgi:hypothetical protein
MTSQQMYCPCGHCPDVRTIGAVYVFFKEQTIRSRLNCFCSWLFLEKDMATCFCLFLGITEYL